MKKVTRLKQNQIHPAAVDEIVKHLMVDAVFFMGMGIFSIVVSLRLSVVQFFGFGFVLIVMGLFIVLLSFEFSRLHRWSYDIVKILISPWSKRDLLSFLISRDLAKKISSPAVQHAFGIKIEDKEQ